VTAGAELYDVAIAGGGPAGAACAILCAGAGLRTLVIEKSIFPRYKVCGDCLNPGCWPVLEELGVAAEVLAAPNARIESVAFVGADGCRVEFPLDRRGHAEIAITRRLLDSILLRRAGQAGAQVYEGTTLRAMSRGADGVWRIEAGERTFSTRQLAAADGRNSTVARLLHAAPSAARDRVGLQAHVPGPAVAGRGIEMHLFPTGYCGVAPVDAGLTNYCLVAAPGSLEALKEAVCSRFRIAAGQEWRAIAPLERAAIGPLRDGVLYLGDAARVVEPFTGEGIYYALQSGVLAARHIIAGNLGAYPAAHAALYRRRLWINGLARWAVKHPRAGGALLRTLSLHPGSLRYLVRRVNAVRPAPACGG
jgi:flavin-dependent dehydrogenase